jgi:hypothetical protein
MAWGCHENPSAADPMPAKNDGEPLVGCRTRGGHCASSSTMRLAPCTEQELVHDASIGQIPCSSIEWSTHTFGKIHLAQIGVDEKTQEIREAFHVQLCSQACAMIVNSSWTDAQFARNLLAGKSAANDRRHLKLPRREPRQQLKSGTPSRSDDLLLSQAGLSRSDGFEKPGCSAGLLDEVDGAKLHSGYGHRDSSDTCEHQDMMGTACADQLLEQLDPRYIGQILIEDNAAGRQLSFCRKKSAAGSEAMRSISLAAHELDKFFTYDRIVVDDVNIEGQHTPRLGS